MLRRISLVLAIAMLAVIVMTACAAPTPVTKEVIKEATKIVEATRIVEATKIVEKVVTPVPPPPTSKKGGTFIVYIAGDPISLNAIMGNDGTSLPAVYLTQEPIVLGGENWGHKLLPNLAEKWEMSKDGKVWTFNLRKDVKWQDGKPFTADDVLFTFKTLQDPKVQSAGFRARVMEGDKPIKFEKIDDYSFRATLENPNPVLAQAIGVPIIPKHILDGQDVNKAPYNQKPIGLGAFKVTEWKSGESVTLEANPTYFKGAPYLDKWIFRVIPNQDAVVVALQSGEVDFANVRGKDVPKFLGNPKYNVVTAPVDLARYIMLNQAKPQFQDKRVRQALSMTLDRAAIVDAAEQGYGVPADSHFNQPVSVYKAGKLVIPKQDFTKAKALMTEAGWVDTNNDGIVEKDGKPFKITLEYNPSWTFMSPVASLIQAWWKQIGVDVTIRTYDAATFTNKVFRSTDLEKPYDVVLNGWGFYGTDANSYAAYYAPTTQGASPFNYVNPEIKALFDKARASLDEKERATLYEQAEKLMWDDLPMIPMYYPVRIFVHSSRVGLDEAVLDTSRFLPFLYPEKVYIRK